MLVIRTVDELVAHLARRIEMVLAQDRMPRNTAKETARIVGMVVGLTEAKEAAEALKEADERPMTDQVKAKDFLRDVVKAQDIDWIIYQLVQGAIEKRTEVDKGSNKAEKAYWQKVVVALNEFLTKCEEGL